MNCTVLLPVFNGAGTLAQAIESILSQSEEDFELLIIDDKSSDGSAEIIRTYMDRNARVQGIFHQTNEIPKGVWETVETCFWFSPASMLPPFPRRSARLGWTRFPPWLSKSPT